MVKIDKKDRRILSALDLDARMPMTELAKKVGLSRQVVEYRIKRLQKEKVIFGALAVFDSVVAGNKWYRVVLRLVNVSEKEKDQMIEYLTGHENVMWLGEVGGNWDIVVNFICGDNFEFNRIFEDLIGLYGRFVLDYEVLIYVNVFDLERKYIFDGKQGRKWFWHEMKQDADVKLDKLDKDIISQLSKNALMNNVELGGLLGVTGNTIRNRINEMKKNKLLLGFRLFVNPSLLGYKSHMLFLAVKKLDLEREKKLYAYIKSIPNATFIVKHIGKWRFGMEIETESEEDFQKIFVEIRGRFNDIISDFESFPLFKDHAINYFPKGCV